MKLNILNYFFNSLTTKKCPDCFINPCGIEFMQTDICLTYYGAALVLLVGLFALLLLVMVVKTLIKTTNPIN